VPMPQSLTDVTSQSRYPSIAQDEALSYSVQHIGSNRRNAYLFFTHPHQFPQFTWLEVIPSCSQSSPSKHSTEVSTNLLPASWIYAYGVGLISMDLISSNFCTAWKLTSRSSIHPFLSEHDFQLAISWVQNIEGSKTLDFQ
jgi:hypothetical protein